LETAKADDHNNPWIYASAGFNKMHLGRSVDGIADVETALRISPSDNAAPQWQAYLCYLRTQLAQWEQAIEQCEKAVAANPEKSMPLADLAAAYAWAGRHMEATQAAVRVRQLSPDQLTYLQIYIEAHDDPTFKAQVARIIDGLRKAGLPEK
jgi:tetratricopeptide (TPR) repeat protein